MQKSLVILSGIFSTEFMQHYFAEINLCQLCQARRSKDLYHTRKVRMRCIYQAEKMRNSFAHSCDEKLHSCPKPLLMGIHTIA